jgi:hypothetical protein
MSVNEPQRQKLKVHSWDAAAGHGVVVDREGCGYPIELSKMGPEFQKFPPVVGEFLEGIVRGPGQVVGIASLGTDRVEFESVGPHPEGNAWAQELGRRLEGGTPQKFGTPDSGKFSHPKDPVKGGVR